MRSLLVLVQIFTVISLQATTIQKTAEPVDDFAIRYHENELYILNQQKLPQEEEWIDVKTSEQMVEIIASLKVHGTPMIGIAAAFSLSQLAIQGASKESLQKGKFTNSCNAFEKFPPYSCQFIPLYRTHSNCYGSKR